MKVYDLIIIGGGAAGLLCAINAKKNGINDILLIEKDPILGGNLNGYNYNISKNGDVIGDSYKNSLINKFNRLNIPVYFNTMVLSINDRGNVIAVSKERAVEALQSKAIILANGSKEKGLNQLYICGDRSSGIISLSTAKKIFNIENMIPGKNIVFYGDKNLHIIEDELKKHNVKIKAIISTSESAPMYSIDPNEIYDNYKINEIKGLGRLSSIVISKDNKTTEITCDTLIIADGFLSDGLVAFRSGITLNPSTTGPLVNENFETSRKNIFACGDGIFIHEFIEELEEEALLLSNHIKKLITL